ncbi:MAG: hypothetical protein GZ090_07455 [Oxalobacteraceae bacterium]|nr:hypothetical protein [Oxalobacteraceae bacterium]
MEIFCVKFIDEITEKFDVFQEATNEINEYWEPDQPPVTIMFAAIGKELVQQFDSIQNEKKLAIFQCIEDGMNSVDIDLKTAVATGIIEALVSESTENEDLWIRIEQQLGLSSKHYALSWRCADHSIPV